MASISLSQNSLKNTNKIEFENSHQLLKENFESFHKFLNSFKRLNILLNDFEDNFNYILLLDSQQMEFLFG